MRSQIRYFLCPVAVLLCALAGAAKGLNKKATPDRLVYMSFQPSNWDIYLFTEARKTPKRLTNYAGLDYDPVVSPDGRWLVFTSERGGNPNLYARDLKHGGRPRILIESERMEDQAAFSPDGKYTYFVSTYSGHADIYRLPFRPGRTMSMKSAERLTHDAEGDFRPAISPDGRVMAFSSDRELPIDARGSCNGVGRLEIVPQRVADDDGPAVGVQPSDRGCARIGSFSGLRFRLKSLT